MKDLTVAAVCMHSVPGDVVRNLERMGPMVQEAAAMGADVVCFPELSVTGYVLEGAGEVYKGIEKCQALDRLNHMARKAHAVLIAGLVESVEHGKPYITQVIAGPSGQIGLYRKTHLSPPEKGLYSPGASLEVYSHGGTTLGVQLCYEVHFPEISAVMALMGAEILFFPHASPRGSSDGKLTSWLRHLPARAFDNGVFVVACNQVGKTERGFSFPGVAVVLDPSGRVLARYRGTRENILMVRLQAEALRAIRQHRMKYFIPHRRPELYAKIAEIL